MLRQTADVGQQQAGERILLQNRPFLSARHMVAGCRPEQTLHSQTYGDPCSRQQALVSPHKHVWEAYHLHSTLGWLGSPWLACVSAAICIRPMRAFQD